MITIKKVIKNSYRDSVSLMQVSAKLTSLKGVTQASLVMASETNLALLKEAGLLTESVTASPNDLLIVVQGEDATVLDEAMDQAESELNKKFENQEGEHKHMPPRSIQMGFESQIATNLVLISAPGEYAVNEALKALNIGLHVMLFSDNISIEDEVMLKTLARKKNLLVMGPDCGTAIINKIPLAFANVVKPGNIGIIAASGTGLQQVSSLIDKLGCGITQALGTGGHDLSEAVGGITMLQGLEALEHDAATDVIVLISKPPAQTVAQKVVDAASKVGKPVVINFLGAESPAEHPANLYFAATLEDAALYAVALSKNINVDQSKKEVHSEFEEQIQTVMHKFSPTQSYIRGLYSGGTFCYEATLLLDKALKHVYSNTPIRPENRLKNVWESQAHTVIDLGDDVFTRGRPHPMIDFRMRNERMLKEAADPETAVILLDIVFGYGSHMSPADAMVPVIHQAKSLAEKSGRSLAFVGFICGTDGDPQNLTVQENKFREAGMFLADSNVQAVQLAAQIALRLQGHQQG